jgi:replicative DNA helicase
MGCRKRGEALIDIAKPLPADADSERAVLGAVLYGHARALELLDLLRPDDFQNRANALIFKSARKLSESGITPDILAVNDELARIDELEAAGGVSYLSALLDARDSAVDLPNAAHRIRDLSAGRRLIHTLQGLQDNAFKARGQVAQILDAAIEMLSSQARDIDETDDLGVTHFDAATHKLSELRQGPRVKIFTGVAKLDQLTGGFREGELVTLTADTGVGKTLLASQTRVTSCLQGFHSLYCSAEMTAAHLKGRELAASASVSPLKMRREDLLTPEDWTSLITAASHECKHCKILDGELCLSRIRRAARRMKKTVGLDLIIFDYDELIDAPGETELDQQRTLVRAAKSLGMELKCAVILISQLRKALNKDDAKRPSLQRLYGSGAKAKHSSFVVFADRPWVREMQGDEKEAKLFILKSRDGQTGPISAVFDIRKLRFTDAPDVPNMKRCRNQAGSNGEGE